MILQIVQSFPLVTLFLSIILILLVMEKKNRKEQLLSKFSGPINYPLIGNNPMEIHVPNEEFSNFCLSIRKTYGERCRIHFGPRNLVLLHNPADVEKLLSSSQNINKGHSYNTLFSWLGEGLLTSSGKKWQHRRKMLTPSFHFKILDNFLVIFNEQSKILVDILADEFKDERVGDIFPPLTRCALDIIGETAMDIKFGSQSSPNSSYLQAVHKACEVTQFKTIRPWCWIDWIFGLTSMGKAYNAALNTLHSFTTKVVAERKSVNKTEAKSDAEEVYWFGQRRLAFLDLLLDAQKNGENNLSDTDIREEVDTFLFEGHDTSSASLSWTTFLLGCNPEYQAKVHAELDSIFGEDRSRPIVTKDLVEMKYLEMCIKEALRLFPSVPFISRNLSTDLVLDKEFIIPEGTEVGLLTISIHRNEEVFPDPETFDPDRFLPENCFKRHPFAYIPFSAGPRNCIGQKFAMMKEKVVLANIFRNFKVEAAQKLEDVTVMMEVIVRPKDGHLVRLIPR